MEERRKMGSWFMGQQIFFMRPKIVMGIDRSQMGLHGGSSLRNKNENDSQGMGQAEKQRAISY